IPTPPANDNFANATTISGTSGTTTGSTTNATREVGEPNHSTLSQFPSPGTASIWFSFTAAGSGNATIDTVGSNFDTIMAVYTGTSVGALTRITDNDDIDTNGGNYRSRVTFAATQGTTYRIAV